MFGGGMKGGFVYGKTADERPARRSRIPYPWKTCTRPCMTRWASRRLNSSSSEKRPVYVTKDGKGKVIRELYA